ncbi:deoxyribose-phosphate aldolase [Corynebacterium auriscanis]|uniref:deoxyribose-phosphate aldolase n=1 Tax=Corynebacterium auriscanis TaxID=99807 RepID=UPI003CE8EB69
MIDTSNLTRDFVAGLLDYTLLKPEATRHDVASLIDAATRLKCMAVCVSPSMLPLAGRAGAEGDAAPLRIATVAGFPSGKHASLIKATEARLAVQCGADEVDVVIDVAAAIAEDSNALLSELMTIREAIPRPVVLKVILESAALTEQQLRVAVRAAVNAGADYVKTSTGFHPAGGATVEAVKIMAQELQAMKCQAPLGMPDEVMQAQGLVGLKASGGIRDWDSAVAMIAAGATRLGVSAAPAILEGVKQPGWNRSPHR